MADLQHLLGELAQAEAALDADAMRAARQKIVATDAPSPARTEARVKLALDSLFVGRNLADCIQGLEQAIKTGEGYWLQVARTTVALCYLQQKRLQKALFELRRVAYGKIVSAHSVTALVFMETVFAQDNKPLEADKVRQERQRQLQQLLRGEGEPAQMTLQERAHFLHQLAMTYAPSSDRSEARAALQQALSIGPFHMGADLWQTVQMAALQEGLATPKA